MAMTLITTNTSSNAASSSFTSSIDSTYKLYIFKFYDINPATDSSNFQVNFSTDGGSNYNATKTTTVFKSNLYEDGSGGALGYSTGDDLAQSTDFQPLTSANGNGADESCAGELHLFNPASTTYVKHFYARLNIYVYVDMSRELYTAGYVNSTDNVDAVQFKMSSGNMDGVIKMWGVK